MAFLSASGRIPNRKKSNPFPMFDSLSQTERERSRDLLMGFQWPAPRRGGPAYSEASKKFKTYGSLLWNVVLFPSQEQGDPPRWKRTEKRRVPGEERKVLSRCFPKEKTETHWWASMFVVLYLPSSIWRRERHWKRNRWPLYSKSSQMNRGWRSFSSFRRRRNAALANCWGSSIASSPPYRIIWSSWWIAA